MKTRHELVALVAGRRRDLNDDSQADDRERVTALRLASTVNTTAYNSNTTSSPRTNIE